MERSKKTIFFFVTKQIRNWFCCGKNWAKYYFFRFQNKIWHDRPLAKLYRSLFCHPYITSQMLLKSELACRVWWSLTGSGCLLVLWGAKQILVLLESCLLTKAYQLELIKINLIVVISIIYFYPYVKQRCVLLSFKKIEKLLLQMINIWIFIYSLTRGQLLCIEEFINREYSLS